MHATVQRIFGTAPVMALANFLAALGFLLSEEPLVAVEQLWRELVIQANLFVSATSLGIWLVAGRLKKKPVGSKSHPVFAYFVVTYVLTVGLVISLIDNLVMTSIVPFLLCVTIVGTFYYLPPRGAVLVFGLSLVVFGFAFGSLFTLPAHILDSILVNGMMAHALGLALSTVGWRHFRSFKLQEKTIAQQQAALTEMAYQDSLTGLPNRRFLDELVEREVALVRRGRTQSCLIMCDIDNFKAVNDTFGHVAGDKMLRAFADLLRGMTRNSNTVVRLGGEEFVILAPQTSPQEAMVLAERLRKQVEEHGFEVSDNILRITASFGVARLEGSEREQDYYHRADQALCQAKFTGKNRVVMTQGKVG